ncbi:HK97-gp10 family putative phage morphogenesis protein [Aquibium sp. LZ166]|uniref:HK97-gp10 family putative phage morphogenesis protein n=1 Tax=Aquibium pacificus TaxID=3153579 RepID=A0ABV3SBC6_9HYPH
MSAQSQKLSRRLNAIPKAVKRAVVPALEQSGNELVGAMRNLAPKDTHALEHSIKYTMPGNATPPYSQPGGSRVAAENQVLVTAGNDEVRYPHLVEYGTAHAPAQPYFWPAFRLKRKRLANRIKRAIRKAVRGA